MGCWSTGVLNCVRVKRITVREKVSEFFFQYSTTPVFLLSSVFLLLFYLTLLNLVSIIPHVQVFYKFERLQRLFYSGLNEVG